MEKFVKNAFQKNFYQDEDDVIHLAENILCEAFNKRASDIHIEPEKNHSRIRLRRDGLLEDFQFFSHKMHSRIVSRFKVMACLDISEQRLPQDGRFSFFIEAYNHEIDCRISCCPTIYGEKLVIRLLGTSENNLDLDALGLENTQKILIKKILQKPNGLILVTGPTGSGKTITLYALLKILNQVHRNILTIENPVEIKIEGINQVETHPKIGLDFLNGLRSFLRQDPDIIMIGEIRDFETADIAIKAAQTGHLVLSTLHTHSAAASIKRLQNLGIASFNLSDTLTCVISQRLVRRLCAHCKKIQDQNLCEKKLYPKLNKDLSKITHFSANGCEKCRLGYLGRTGIYEIFEPQWDMQNKLDIYQGTYADQLEPHPTQKISLFESGFRKVQQGITSLEELHRVLN